MELHENKLSLNETSCSSLSIIMLKQAISKQ